MAAPDFMNNPQHRVVPVQALPETRSPAAALAVYALVWGYSLAVPLLGRSVNEAAYTALAPFFTAMIGYTLFAPFTAVFESRGAVILLTALAIYLVLIAAVAWARWKMNRRPLGGVNGAAFRLAGWYLGYLALLAACECVVAGVRMSPLFMIAALPWAGLYALRVRTPRRRAAGWTIKIGAALLLAFGMFGRIPVLVLLGIMVVYYPAAGYMLRRPAFDTVRHWGAAAYPAAMLLFCAGCGLAAVGTFWKSPDGCGRALLRANNACLIPGTMQRPYDALIPEGTRQLYVTYKHGAVSQVDLDTLRTVRTVDLRAMGMRGSTQRLIYNPETKEIYTTYWRAQGHGAVAVFHTRPLHLARVVREPKCPAISLQLDSAHGQLVALCESGRRLVWFDYHTWEKQGELRFPLLTQPHTVRLDPVRRRLYVCTGAMSHFLYEIDADSHRILRRAHIGFATLGMEIDPKRRRAYLAKPQYKKILIVDLDAMKPKGFMKTRNGPRDLEIDTGRGLLYVGNYVAGSVQVFDLDTRRQVREYATAKQVRGVYHSPELNRHFAATACGVLELRPAGNQTCAADK